LPRANKVPIIAFAVLTAISLFVHPIRAEIVLDTAYPVVRQHTRVLVSDDSGAPVGDAEITVTYRPGSAVEASTVVGRTGGDGAILWTPSEAGIVTISATWTDADQKEQTTSVNSSIKFDPTPITGILIMIIAGVVLIGGSIERIWSLLHSPETN